MTILSRLAAATATLAIAGAAILSGPVSAQDWPSKPIRIIVGFGAGGGTDIATRVIAQPLSEVLGQPVVVENRPGAGGTTAGNLVAKAAPDGYTGVMLSAGHTVGAVVFKELPYDSVKDFTPVGVIANSAFAIVTYKDFPANDLQGLVKAAKAAPGKVRFASVGLGSTQHFTGEAIAQLAGIQVRHIPYKGTPALIGALRGKEIEYGVELVHTMIGQIRSGDLKILAVATPQRWPVIPDVPTIAESGVAGFQALGWYGLAFPAKTPQSIVDRTNAALKVVLSREAVRKQLADVGALAALSTPQEFGTLLESEIEKWRDVAKRAGIEAR